MTEPMPDSAPKRRVKFGNQPTQTVPFEWAEAMLTKWAETEPLNFGRYLAFAGLGQLPKKQRGSGE